MIGIMYYLFPLILVGTLVWELASGTAVGQITGRVTREDNPGVYWFLIGIQLVILVLFLLTGRSWTSDS